MFRALGSFNLGAKTATAGTEITQLIAPRNRAYTRVTTASYRAAGTAHTLTALRTLNQTVLSAAAAAGQAVISLAADPGSIAANDFVAILKPDGTYHLGKVSSVSTLDVTLTANVPTGGFAAGAKVFFFGAIGDGHPQFAGTATTLETYQDTTAGIVASNNVEEPILLHSGNATAAGVLERVSGVYTMN
jgi:hypothetical protein